MIWNIGDRVLSNATPDFGIATIIYIEGKGILLEFDSPGRKLHSGGGIGGTLHCWWADPSELVQASPPIHVPIEQQVLNKIHLLDKRYKERMDKKHAKL